MAWTDEKRKLVIDEYVNTMENEYATDEERARASMEVVRELSEIHGETPNGVRGILSAAKVFIKKTNASTPAAASTGAKRVNKAEAIASLKSLIILACNNDNAAIDADIIDKLTGKAAMYFSGVLQQAIGE